jgi:aminoglycoside phosphotransferase (APT) family kinase protein
MDRPESTPSARSLEEVQRLAGPLAVIHSVARLEGGQHADTWRVDTRNPDCSVVVRQFPPGDPAAAREQRVLQAIDGLGGVAPVLLASDLDGRWSRYPASVISWLDGQPDITPADPERWATQLGHALAAVHAVPGGRLADLPSVFECRGGSREVLNGPLAAGIRSDWARLTTPPVVLTHTDYWSGNVVWRDGELTGIVDWSGGARGPRGYDVGWCRLDLVLLFGEHIADTFLAAYETAAGRTIEDVILWDRWAGARSHDTVETWGPNYAPFGRADLYRGELRRRHSRWTAHLMDRM